MEDNIRKEKNKVPEITRVTKDDRIAREQGKSFDNQYQFVLKTPFNRRLERAEQYDKKRKSFRSRSRSRSKLPQKREHKSANAFIIQQMLNEKKVPYTKIARSIKQQTEQDTQNGQQNKTNAIDTSKKPQNRKDEKRKERKKRKRSRSRTDDSDTDSDSVTSGATSEDVSDPSS